MVEQSAEFVVGSGIRKRLQSLVHSIRTDRKQLAIALLGRVYRFKVFSAQVTRLVRLETKSDVQVKKLTTEDILRISMPEWLKDEQKERIRRFGFNGAYAVFCDQHLAHISWLIPAEREQPRTLALRPEEAEITACFTLPEFRGRNIYPFAIAYIGESVNKGVLTLYMKTTFANVGSQRGIMKAGLQPSGWVVEYDLPRWMGKRWLTIRGFRWFQRGSI